MINGVIQQSISPVRDIQTNAVVIHRWHGTDQSVSQVNISTTNTNKYALVSSSLVCPSGEQGLSFDDLRAYYFVPSSYGGFQWSNMASLNITAWQQNGGQVLYNVNASPMNITRINGSFTLHTLRVPFMSTTNLNVTIKGFIMGTLVKNNLHILNNTYNWHVLCNISNIDMLSISFSPASPAIVTIDDFCFSVL